MRLIFLADLHGNLPATLAMEKTIARLSPDDVWFLGDAVGKGPQSRETCDWVRSHCHHCIGGNWDYGIGNKEYPADVYYWNQLGEERMQWLSQLPRELELTLGSFRFRLFHGRPVTPLLKVSSPSAELEDTFHSENGSFHGVIFADSHRPFIRTLSSGYIINTGSVGNSMGVPRAHAFMLDWAGHEADPFLFTILSVPYDNELAAELAHRDPDLPFQGAYIQEILTGVYSR